MQARMKNQAMIIPEAMKALQALHATTQTGGVPPATLELQCGVQAGGGHWLELNRSVLVQRLRRSDRPNQRLRVLCRRRSTPCQAGRRIR